MRLLLVSTQLNLLDLWRVLNLFCLNPGTPLHIAAKERNKRVVRFLVENGAFLPPDLNDHRFNPPLHYCSGLEWAYEMKRMQDESDSGGEASLSSSS
ncbi:unnamed protein product [Triticum turgidum subsp. durum]|uniref:Uncharacterized protein n=1 Tax=Triticum turgidum subsp. durum TaxID=4567 RepID=A0A9R1RUN4_TRITD|nr:unnamed protein product [Triticum turgidum subsp. durum]